MKAYFLIFSIIFSFVSLTSFKSFAQDSVVQLFCENFDTTAQYWKTLNFNIPNTTQPGFEQDTAVTLNGSIGSATDTVGFNSFLLRHRTYLQTPNLGITGYSNVTVQFSHIGYISQFDEMRFQYSLDGGSTWLTCGPNEYFGNSTMILPGNFFNKLSRPILWKYADQHGVNNDTNFIWTANNSQNAWVNEEFRIGNVIAALNPKPDSVMFRIELLDGGQIGRVGTHRYYLDDFCVTASNLATDLSDSNQKDFQLQLFPNPVSTTFQVNLPKHAVDRLLIRDIQGRIVMLLNPTQKEVRVDVADLENGIYYLQVVGDGLNQYQKFIKQ
jgi:hypothetical protein